MGNVIWKGGSGRYQDGKVWKDFSGQLLESGWQTQCFYSFCNLSNLDPTGFPEAFNVKNQDLKISFMGPEMYYVDSDLFTLSACLVLNGV